MSQNEIAISVQGLKKSYKNVPVLEGVDFEVKTVLKLYFKRAKLLHFDFRKTETLKSRDFSDQGYIFG